MCALYPHRLKGLCVVWDRVVAQAPPLDSTITVLSQEVVEMRPLGKLNVWH